MEFGIVAIEVYFPHTFVAQTDLEERDHCKDKYTKGLGQEGLACCSELEDVNSISLTVVNGLLEKYRINPLSIGRVDVGTESLVDKSKSVKSVIMKLFESSPKSSAKELIKATVNDSIDPLSDCNIEGADNINACYGGTAALFNAINWLRCNALDHPQDYQFDPEMTLQQIRSAAAPRSLALIVSADIAVYAEGPARPTGGCGAVAILLGPKAPIIFEPENRASFSKHVWDFYKPAMASEYPIVDGAFSLECYLSALIGCQNILSKKLRLKEQRKSLLEDFDYFIFHSPFQKLVRKAFAKLVLFDLIQNQPEISRLSLSSSPRLLAIADLFEKLSAFLCEREIHEIPSTSIDMKIIDAVLPLVNPLFDRMVGPSTLTAKKLGNLYTASVFSGLASWIFDLKGHSTESGVSQQSETQRVLCFSYGSGLCSSMFSWRVRAEQVTAVKEFHQILDLNERLAMRRAISVEEMLLHFSQRELRSIHLNQPFSTTANDAILAPGTWYLAEIDENLRRRYLRFLGQLTKVESA